MQKKDGAPKRRVGMGIRECWLRSAQNVSGDWGLTLHGVGSYCKIKVRLDREHIDIAWGGLELQHGSETHKNIEARFLRAQADKSIAWDGLEWPH